MESFVLAARRVGREGADVVIATSDEPLDEAIVNAAATAGIKTFRGSKNDVLARFAGATADMNDDDIVVRLTADNPFPDPEFIDRVSARLDDPEVEYVRTLSPDDGLPYGLSVEAFRVSTLRKAATQATTEHDREHVTAWMMENCNWVLFDDLKDEVNAAGLRCTLDTFADYQNLRKLFADIKNPVDISWRELVSKLEHLSKTPKNVISEGIAERATTCAMVLGTAQLGLDYGTVNTRKMPSATAATEIVHHAQKIGISALDSARAYGESEARLGQALNQSAAPLPPTVITKLDPLAGLAENAQADDVLATVDQSIEASCKALGRQNLDVLLLHRAGQFKRWNGAAWKQLCDLQHQGRIAQLGASVQSPIELTTALEHAQARHVQLPFNILDWRWDADGTADRLKMRADVTVHARSTLLQGILAETDPARWPQIDGFDPVPVIAWLSNTATAFGRISVVDLCFAFARSQGWIDALVIGVDNIEQLDRGAALFAQPLLSNDQIAEICKSRPRVPAPLLDPAQWPGQD